ncbi:MAG: phosphoglucosamine mutase [Actinomycetota bacterium]|nr:phosphoglucosamine mutase [Actinomycetota bacterium]MED5220294.1 phosphoglucosamine mutase [Actinomycetota bacterium]MEE3354351.1 phosphoglucosamine mutase [Actinomycetota bacterium]
MTGSGVPPSAAQPLRFGTDGVRARAGTILDEVAVRALGRAAAAHLGAGRVVVGRDTRESGPSLARALAEGLIAGGLEVTSLGMVPTPAVAYECHVDGVAGAVVSASHNPWFDNGIKLFAAGGRKLDDWVQSAVQKTWDACPRLDEPTLVPDWADPEDPTAGGRRWVDALIAGAVEGSTEEQGSNRPLAGWSLVVDCANGATSPFAVDVLSRLGAEVGVLHASPNGRNINEGCGSTHPDDLRAAVVDAGADAGLAFDGDGDRVVAVGDDGAVLDGDDLLAVCGVDLHGRGLLTGDTVAVTVMSNLGLRRALDAHGIAVHETPVGDRHVLEALEANDWVLGGEQSGHVIFRSMATTGDGLLTGIHALIAAGRAGRTLGGRVADLVVRAPQVLHAVPVAADGVAVVAALVDEIAEAGAELGSAGRVLVRPSGTEPVVRVMVEASDAAEAAAVADRLVDAVHRADRT